MLLAGEFLKTEMSHRNKKYFKDTKVFIVNPTRLSVSAVSEWLLFIITFLVIVLSSKRDARREDISIMLNIFNKNDYICKLYFVL